MPRRTHSTPERLTCDQLLDLIALRSLHQAADPPCRVTTPRQVSPQYKDKQPRTEQIGAIKEEDNATWLTLARIACFTAVDTGRWRPTKKGDHANQTRVDCDELGVRTYIPEHQSDCRRWTDKPAETEAAFRKKRRGVKRAKVKPLQRTRSELIERGFAHVRETGGARRTWHRGLEKINRRYQIVVAARILIVLL